MTADPASAPIVISDRDKFLPALTLEDAIERRNGMVSFVQQIMRDGLDYGNIPGSAKPMLFEPGAEKLGTWFGHTSKTVLVDSIEDWEKGFFYYRYRTTIYRHGEEIASVEGSCNSHESKYRWRWVTEDQLPPNIDADAVESRSSAQSEFCFAIDKSETGGQYGKPTAYWQQFKDAIAAGTARKTTRTTKKGKSLDAWEIGSRLYRIENDDIASQVNTIQKMSQKRSFVGAEKRATNASEYFSQDLEDLAPIAGAAPAPTADDYKPPQQGEGEDEYQQPPFEGPIIQVQVREKQNLDLKNNDVFMAAFTESCEKRGIPLPSRKPLAEAEATRMGIQSFNRAGGDKRKMLLDRINAGDCDSSQSTAEPTPPTDELQDHVIELMAKKFKMEPAIASRVLASASTVLFDGPTASLDGKQLQKLAGMIDSGAMNATVDLYRANAEAVQADA